jgi:hypothetical protein
MQDSSRTPVWAATASLLSTCVCFAWAMLAPASLPVGGALVSMACLAASLHAIGRAHIGR